MTPPAGTAAPGRLGERGRSFTGLAGSVGMFLRHQAGAIFVTSLDFATMSLLVQGFGVSAVLGTVVGATVGGVVNFTLGRRWIFGQATESAHGQAVRYLVVWATSLALNAGGEYVLHDRLGLQFQLARALIAVAVSVAWNYPMQRHFVFRPSASATL